MINRSEWLSSGRTIDYANTIYLTTGNILYSNRSRPMWTIVEDTVGRHDFLLTPCSLEMFRILYQDQRTPSELLREPRSQPRALRDRCQMQSPPR